jgi:hypothetical protein
MAAPRSEPGRVSLMANRTPRSGCELRFFDPDGRHLRTIRVIAADGRQLLVGGAFGDGSLLVQGAAI